MSTLKAAGYVHVSCHTWVPT